MASICIKSTAPDLLVHRHLWDRLKIVHVPEPVNFFTLIRSPLFTLIFQDKYKWSICVWRKCLICTLMSGHHFQLQRWASLDAQLRPITPPLRGHQQYSEVCPGLVQSLQISDCPVSRSGLDPPANTHCAPTALKKKHQWKGIDFSLRKCFSLTKALKIYTIHCVYPVITIIWQLINFFQSTFIPDRWVRQVYTSHRFEVWVPQFDSSILAPRAITIFRHVQCKYCTLWRQF